MKKIKKLFTAVVLMVTMLCLSTPVHAICDVVMAYPHGVLIRTDDGHYIEAFWDETPGGGLIREVTYDVYDTNWNYVGGYVIKEKWSNNGSWVNVYVDGQRVVHDKAGNLFDVEEEFGEWAPALNPKVGYTAKIKTNKTGQPYGGFSKY